MTEPGVVFDRDQAREVHEHLRQAILAMLHDQAGEHYTIPSDEMVDIYVKQFEAITAARVRPATLDQDALIQVLIDAGHPLTEARYVTGQILALVRPVAGVVLSPDDRSIVLGWYGLSKEATVRPPSEREQALAARLVAGS
jgi:hypothetical protein